MDSLIRALDRLPEVAPEAIVYALKDLTGQSFGPVYDQPLHKRPAEIEKWKTWWKDNREVFSPNRDRILGHPSSGITKATREKRPIPKSLPEYVREVEFGSMDYDGMGHGQLAAKWLEENGRHYVEELGAMAQRGRMCGRP